MEATASSMSQAWDTALSRHECASRKLASDNQLALASTVSAFEQHSASLVRTVDQSQSELRAQWVAQDEQRLAAWNSALDATSAALLRKWDEAGSQASERQRQLCESWVQAADNVAVQAQSQASGTLAQIAGLVQPAEAAPKEHGRAHVHT